MDTFEHVKPLKDQREIRQALVDEIIGSGIHPGSESLLDQELAKNMILSAMIQSMDWANELTDNALKNYAKQIRQYAYAKEKASHRGIVRQPKLTKGLSI